MWDGGVSRGLPAPRGVTPANQAQPSCRTSGNSALRSPHCGAPTCGPGGGAGHPGFRPPWLFPMTVWAGPEAAEGSGVGGAGGAAVSREEEEAGGRAGAAAVEEQWVPGERPGERLPP